MTANTVTADPAFSVTQALKGLGNLITARFKRPLTIILDAGHGGADSGAVGNGTQEALQVAEFVATAAFFLRQLPNVRVIVSRGAERPSWAARTFGLGRADLSLSIHMDSAKGGRSMAYYAAGTDNLAYGPVPSRSLAFARCLMDATPDPEFVVQPDSMSRFGRLYIRGFLAPVAVLWELDPVHPMTRAERCERAAQLVDALSSAIQSGVVGV